MITGSLRAVELPAPAVRRLALLAFRPLSGTLCALTNVVRH